jgi:uncharacterized protein
VVIAHPRILRWPREVGKKATWRGRSATLAAIVSRYRRIPPGAIKVEVPAVSQLEDYTCGPAALLAVCGYFGVGPASERELEQVMGIDRTGSDPEHLVRAARRYGLRIEEWPCDMPRSALEGCLRKGRPVIIMLQAWAEPRPRSYRRVWRHGHWVVAIGFDDDGVYFEDPALPRARGFLSFAELDERWHDVAPPGRTRVHRYGVAMWRPGVRQSMVERRARRID